jgi:hypothetical protein
MHRAAAGTPEISRSVMIRMLKQNGLMSRNGKLKCGMSGLPG